MFSMRTAASSPGTPAWLGPAPSATSSTAAVKAVVDALVDDGRCMERPRRHRRREPVVGRTAVAEISACPGELENLLHHPQITATATEKVRLCPFDRSS